MGSRKLVLMSLSAFSLLASLAMLGTVVGQQVHKNGFETRDLTWIRGAADAPFKEAIHEITDQNSHSGKFSEHIQLTADKGNYIHYVYPISKAPIGDELGASLWLKANRPGVQIMGRVVLPRERDPNNLDERLTTLLRGDQYMLASRWQRLELRRPVKLAKEQQQLMRAELKRDVDFTDAYLDRIILNVYGGPGLTELWIDDLEVSPVEEGKLFQPTSRPQDKQPAASGSITDMPPMNRAPRAAIVELNQDQLLVSGKRFFFLGIRHSDTPLKALRDAGFNTVWFDYTTPPQRLEEAVNLGFWIVPALPVTMNDARLASPGAITQEAMRFPVLDAVLFWDLGGGLVDEQKSAIANAVRALRAADPQKPLSADVWDGFRPYSRSLDLIGVHRWPLMTSLELTQYRDWLNQRRLLARPGTFLWTWVQTHLPDWYTTLVYDRSATAGGFNEPIGPQPEQIRLLSYLALSSGCRGLGFWSDRFLADTHQGRDRLLTLALLNQEIQLLEPLLLTAEPPIWINTDQKDIKAAVMRSDRGVLVLPMWLGIGAQFVPGQAAAKGLKIVVPEVPTGTQAWEITPASVRSLPTERVVGGTQVTLPEFGLTTAIIFTSDNSQRGLLVRLQDQSRRMRKLAAQWAHDLAQVEIEKVVRVEQQLEQMGHTLPDGQALVDSARARLKSCEEQWENGDYSQAYAEAERSMRPLRILMRAQWEQAIHGLDVMHPAPAQEAGGPQKQRTVSTAPVASPYAVSFFTLPRHWQFLQQIQQMALGSNILPDGSFELGSMSSWTPQQATLDNMDLIAQRVAESPKDGAQSLVLEIKPKVLPTPDGKIPAPPAALERTYLAMNSPPVRLPPGTLVRISGWARIPTAITASADGALFYDSIGGEPLAIRLHNAMTWRQFVLYRQVPASGIVSVTLALTGIGKVFFDDVRIEAYEAGPRPPAPAPLDSDPKRALIKPASTLKVPAEAAVDRPRVFR